MKIGNNERCYCGSGKKYKKCCMVKDSEVEKEARTQEEKELDDWLREDWAEGLKNLAEVENNKNMSMNLVTGEISTFHKSIPVI